MPKITKEMVCLCTPNGIPEYHTFSDNLILFHAWMEVLVIGNASKPVKELLEKGWTIRKVRVIIEL